METFQALSGRDVESAAHGGDTAQWQAVRLLTAKDRVQYQGSTCGIFGRQLNL
jgi:hypothetical protein